MRRRGSDLATPKMLTFAALLLLPTIAAALPAGGCRTAATKSLPFCDTSLDRTARAQDLVRAATKPSTASTAIAHVDFPISLPSRCPGSRSPRSSR